MYKFLIRDINNKKGFTLTEILITVAVLGILAAVAVPLYFDAASKRRKEDCLNQKQMISTVVKEIMTGMMDSGKTQPEIRFELFEDCTDEDDFVKVGGEKKYVKIVDDLTIADIRGRYRYDKNNNECEKALESTEKPTYDEGCQNQHRYLKKFKLQETATPIYTYFANQEKAVCPCDENAVYLLDKDGNCYCSECDNIPVPVPTTAAAS